MDIKGIYFEKYKCFEKGLIDNIKPINVVFGKNNIGKSSILDIVEGLYNNRIVSDKLMISTMLSETQIEEVFSKKTSGGFIAGNHFEYGKKFIGKNFWIELSKVVSSFKKEFVENGSVDNSIFEPRFNNLWKKITSSVHYDKKIVKRIFAERNVLPEDLTNNIDVDGNGSGITNIINNYLNNNDYEENLVRGNLLNKLNEIMGEDAIFTEIVTQQIGVGETKKWEIFLREETKGRIALSSSGSGLKTILMVLVYTILVPDEEQKEISNYLFMFEELENNLHPSLQRRLLNYIEELTKEGATFFLTTHSNVVLDAFQNNDDVNMLHVLKDENNKVNIINVSDNVQKNDVLNDLGIKASDLLQSNGIIWVEGPSDRIYVNKWIELWSNGKYREGKNYQCIFYGGRLLSHLSLNSDEEKDLINLIKSNRNCIVMIDSDKSENRSHINATKIRIREECWC